MLLSYEDAYFYKLILQGGFHQKVNEWIDNIATNNDVLEGIYLDLVCNQNNLNELISCLHSYIGNNKIDDKGLCDRLRLFIKEKLDEGEISYEEVANSLCGFAIKSEKWEEEPWKDFYMLSVYGYYMDGGFLDVEDYHKIVSEFVNTGILLHPDDFWKKKDNKMKERAYKEFQNKHKASIIITPIVVLFAVIIMIIMACNGIKDTKIYLLFSLAILIGVESFCYSLYVLKKSKEEDNK